MSVYTPQGTDVVAGAVIAGRLATPGGRAIQAGAEGSAAEKRPEEWST